MSFNEAELLNFSPLGIVVCNAEQRVDWCNSKFLADFDLRENQVIDQLYVSLPIEAVDKKAHMVQQFDDTTRYSKQFHYWQSKQQDKTIHYFALVRNGTSKLELLQAAKLPKRPNWVEFLDYEVSRSRRYDNPLSILKLQVLVDNQPDSLDDEELNLAIKDALMDELRWADMIGNTHKGSFLMVLPETPAEALDQLSKKITSAISAQLKSLSKQMVTRVVYGSSHWQKNDDSNKLLTRARNNLVSQLEEALKTAKN